MADSILALGANFQEIYEIISAKFKNVAVFDPINDFCRMLMPLACVMLSARSRRRLAAYRALRGPAVQVVARVAQQLL